MEIHRHNRQFFSASSLLTKWTECFQLTCYIISKAYGGKRDKAEVNCVEETPSFNKDKGSGWNKNEDHQSRNQVE